MKEFLKRRWHGVPIGALLSLIVAGAVLAYVVISGVFTVTIKEPLTVSYSLDGVSWKDLSNNFSIPFGLYAGQEQDLYFKMCNASPTGSIKVGLELERGCDWVTVTGKDPNGVNLLAGNLTVPGGTCPVAETLLSVDGGVPEGASCTISGNFTRS